MEDENAPAAKKDVWLMRRELEIRLESLEDLVKQNHLELQKQILNLRLNPPAGGLSGKRWVKGKR
jgi:hypothetical protein